MKKLALVILCLLACTATFAQEDGKEKLEELEKAILDGDGLRITSKNKVVCLDFLNHIGWGAHVVTSKDFDPWRGHSGEAFLNLFCVKINPTKWFGLDLGCDFGFQYFMSKEQFFTRDADAKVVITPFTAFGLGFDEKRSTLSNVRFSFPALLDFKIDKFSIGLGAEATLNFGGDASYKYEAGYQKLNSEMSGVDVNLFTWDAIAIVSYYKLGVLFKYRPASVQVYPGNNPYPKMSFWTIGAILGF